MLFGTKPRLSKYDLTSLTHENTEITRVDTIKYLGMKLDPNLSLDHHVEYIKSKTFGKVKLLGRLNDFLLPDTMLMLYKTLILPIMDYGDIVYDGMTQKNALALQRVQNMAFKNILKAPKLTPTTTMHSELDMLTLSQRRMMHNATQMYKIHTGNGPDKTCDLFERRKSVSSFCTRSVTQGDFNIPLVKLECTKRCFSYRGVMTWTGLPNWLKLAPSLDEFKSSIRQWLLDGDNNIT